MAETPSAPSTLQPSMVRSPQARASRIMRWASDRPPQVTSLILTPLTCPRRRSTSSGVAQSSSAKTGMGERSWT
ncbi:hypothetical protein SMICM17S_13234 [Streptomyces microflavus]